MLDITFIRENAAKVAEAAKNKGVPLDVNEVLSLASKRRELLSKVEEYRRERNRASKSIGAERDAAKRTSAIKKMQGLKEQGSGWEKELSSLDATLHALMLRVPNIPAADVPIGDGDAANSIVETHGKLPAFSFQPKDHIALGASLDLIDLERGVSVSGFRGYYLKNEGALMHVGLLMLAIAELRKRGFTLMVPPTILKGFALTGSGHFPFAEQEIYEIANPARLAGEKEKERMFLAGTSEPALLAYYADKKLERGALPIKVAGISPCYRSEVGSYGKINKGLYRLHEFWKVEQVILCANSMEETEKYFQELLEVPKTLLEKLELPYRIVNVCTGDMGEGKYRMYDIETYMPSLNAYGETHSNSALTDWQARRLNTRYETEGGAVQFVHTLNNTAIASPRLLIALLENHQQEDGSVRVPKALQPYVGTKVIRPKHA